MSTNQDEEFVVRGPESIGIAIREHRARRSISQADLAQQAGLHRSYLSAIESGHTTEAVRNLMRALKALDLEMIIRPSGHQP
jgi:transcriptional regulator with XRE-family HTH domain